MGHGILEISFPWNEVLKTFKLGSFLFSRCIVWSCNLNEHSMWLLNLDRMLICYKPLAAFRKQTLNGIHHERHHGRHHGRSKESFGYDVSTAEGLRINTGWGWVLSERLCATRRKYICRFLLCSSGALRQEKLELSAQVKRLHATVDHLQGSLNQVREEVTL